ncbi:synaptonemal complex protein 3-like [Artibeus jamaicensis]|uniref:synaptonemal complex protein 3-like n=1 Tax=Artibeus jamaicensis TaxID=9417 RepID=UPI00235AAED4|nr:synaptonemal complex protein 3-like [Artibeus jamaicensis]
MAEGWSRVRCRAPGAGEASLPQDAGTDAGTDAGMVPSGRTRLKRELKALLGDQARAACDSGRQGRRESAEVPKESSELIDSDGGDGFGLGVFGRSMGNALQNMPERFREDVKKVLRARRKQFVTETNAVLRAINQKLGNAVKKRQEQRLKFYREYHEKFLTLFWEWHGAAQKTKKEEEKLIILFHKQQDLFRKAKTVQSQRLKKIKNLHDQFLKDVRAFEENQNYLDACEGKEFRQEMAALARKIMVDVQRQELANIRAAVQCLLL